MKLKFNKHFELKNEHAFLSPSKHTWINYSDEEIVESFDKWQAAARGTQLHDLASTLVKLGLKLAPVEMQKNLKWSGMDSVIKFVNDMVDDDMSSEVPLKVSNLAFGTTDGICYELNDSKLKIYDLKTGDSQASMDQLKIYAAYFCIEYDIDPRSITIELRIYQHGTCESIWAEPQEILMIVDRTISANGIAQAMLENEEG